MNCPSCGRANASDRVECNYCEALLVDIFDSQDEKTDPMMSVSGVPVTTTHDERGTDSGNGFTRPPPTATQYTGDLPRLFRFGNRYQILEKLGEGGMGRVYKALDLELDRPIALKTIRTDKGKGAEVLKRFKQELVLARKITHKNVVRIYDLGEAEGMKFFTMELVDGQSLRDILREKKMLPVKEAADFMKQMLSGLAEAHGQGVVHRDLKPHNIMVDSRGTLRIMDFGIARTADTATLTGSGEMMGTPDYISPEQVKGETAGPPSDLFSCGVILYELLTGEVPFKGDTPISKIVARLQSRPVAPRALNLEIPGYLERIVLKLMEIDPDLRYKSAGEVLQDLEREQVDRSLLLRTRKTISRRRGWIAAACLIAALAGGSLYFIRTTSPEPVAAADVKVTTLAILPFQNTTGNPGLAWMESGIPEMLITDISQSRSLRPVLAERIERILSELGKADQSKFDEQTIQRVSETAAADYSLQGSFVEAQGRLRMDLILRQSGTKVAWPIKIEGAPSDVFLLVDQITKRVSEELKLETSGETNLPINEVTTKSLDAFRAYQQGLAELQRGANQSAVPLFQEAIRDDPGFAMANARLAEAYFHLGDQARALASVSRADALSRENRLPRPQYYQIHAISARIHDDPETAVASYKELAALYPNDPDVLASLASSLETLGEVPGSIDAYKKVLALSPSYGAAVLGLGRMLVVSGEPDEAIPLLNQAVDKGTFEGDMEALGMIHSILGVAYRDMAQYESAVQEFEQSLVYRRRTNDPRGVATSLSNLASVLRREKRFDEARKYLDEALTIARETHNRTMESLALLNLGNLFYDSGDLDRALDHYRRSLNIEWDRNEHTEIAVRLDAVARVLGRRALFADALVYLELSKQHLESSEDSKEKAFNSFLTGDVERARGDYDAAQAALLDALQLSRRIEDGPTVARCHLILARLYADQGRFDEALNAIDSAETADTTSPRETATEAHLARAEVFLEIGDQEKASEEMALSAAGTETSLYDVQLRVRLVSARANERSATSPSPAAQMKEVIREARPDDLVEIELRGRLELGRLYLRAGLPVRSIEVLRRVREDALERQLVPIQARASLALAENYRRNGQLEDARRMASEAASLGERFGADLIVAQATQLLAEAARSLGHSDEVHKIESKVQDRSSAVLTRVPEELRPAFLAAHPWAGPREGKP